MRRDEQVPNERDTERVAEHADTISRRQLFQRAALAGLGATAGALLEGGLPNTARAQSTQKRELVVAQAGDISTFDPQASSGINDVRVTLNIFDNLTSRHPDGKLYPALATEWTLVAPTTYRFKLREGVKWHNGEPFTSQDVKFSLERIRNKPLRVYYSMIEDIQTSDASTLLIRTKQPDPVLPARFGLWGGQIVPKTYLERVGDDAFRAHPIGTGPLQFESWTKDDNMVLKVNPDYWGGKMDVDRVIFRPIPETATRVGALQKGEIDLMTLLPPDHIDRVANNPTTRVASVLLAGLYVLTVNSKVPPLNNPLVKQAMSLAIDRKAIVKELWRGRALVPNGPIIKGDNYYDPTLPPLPYDPKEAKERLKRAGYKNEPVYIETNDGYTANDKAMAEAIAAMWKDIGVNVVTEVIEYSVRAQKSANKSFKGLWWSDPVSTTGDPDGMMWRLLAPGAVHDYWRHPEFDRLGDAARYSLDEKFRAQAYKRMTQLFLEYNPWIIVIQPYENFGSQKYVNFQAHPVQLVELRPFNFSMRRT